MGCSGLAQLGCQLLRRLALAIGVVLVPRWVDPKAPNNGHVEGRFSDASGLRIAVIVARFNDLVTAKLLSGCLDCLHRHGVDTSADSAQLDVAWVPGSFELPRATVAAAAVGIRW